MSIIEKAVEKLDQDKVIRVIGSAIRASGSVTIPSRLQTTDQYVAFEPQFDRMVESDTDDKIKHLSDESANISSAVEIDLSKLEKMGILVPGNPNKRLAEEIRRIKRPLLISAFDENFPTFKNRNLIMVTSALLGEGKTFVALSLAMSVAMEINRTVLLVDADVAKQSLANRMGSTGLRGLSDFLVDEDGQDLTDFLLKTNIPKLTFLPAGRANDHITELWASDKMCALMNELSERYKDRLVIFDTPPLLAETSGSVLARSVGQILMVIEAEKTAHHVVMEALNTIADCERIGLVLNKSNRRYSTDYSYYYDQ